MTTKAFTFGPFELIPQHGLLLKNGERCHLSSRALEILASLVERAGEIVSNKEIMARVWPHTFVEDANLRVHMTTLRRTLGDSLREARYIVNVPGRGYRFIAPVAQYSRSLNDQGEHQNKQEAAKQALPLDDLTEENLPVLLTSLIGRNQAVAGLAELLQHYRLVTVVGAGGIGKTSVALATAWRIIDRYEHRVCFVDLASLPRSGLVIGAVAAALRLETVSAISMADLLAFLRSRRMLIVLDNCEHVVDETAMLAEALLRGAPGLHILATSREPLRAEGERIQRLTPLEFPPAAQVDISAAEAMTFSAIELFVERAAACLGNFVLSDDDAPVVADICRKLDGIPLAIELAAARVDLLSLRAIAEKLDNQLSLLTQGRRTATPRHQTLRAALDWSFDILSEHEQCVLVRLGVFGAAFTSDMVIAIVSGEGLTEDDVMLGLEGLVAKSLVVADVSGRRTYYRLLETTRSYALEKLGAEPKARAVQRRHAEYFRESFVRADIDQEEQAVRGWLDTYGRCIDDVRRALDWSFSPTGDCAIGATLTINSAPIWLKLSLIDEYERYLGLALERLPMAPLPDRRREMELNTKLGLALFNITGPGPRLVSAYGRALELAESLDDIPCQLTALWGLFWERNCAGDYRGMLNFAMRFNDVTAKSDDTLAPAMGHRLMALAYHHLGEQNVARLHSDKSISLIRSTGDSSLNSAFYYNHLATALSNLASVLWLQGSADQAMSTMERAVEHAASLEDPVSLCYVLAFTACPQAFWIGDRRLVDRYIAMLLDLSMRNNFAYMLLWGRSYEALRARQENPASEAADWLSSNRSNLVPLHREILATLDQDYVDDETVARAENGHEGWCAAEILRAKGERLLKQGGAGAESVFQRSREIARRQGAIAWELRAVLSLARLLRDQGKTGEAYEILAPLRASFTEGFTTSDIMAADALLDELAPSQTRKRS